jgi:hypothetical protein
MDAGDSEAGIKLSGSFGAAEAGMNLLGGLHQGEEFTLLSSQTSS